MGKKILLIGMPGCGKTTVGKELSKKIQCNFLDMDDFIEKNSQKTIKELFKYGEEHFRDVETYCCKLLSDLDNIVISSGGGVVKRDENMRCFSHFQVVFINRPIELIMENLDIDSRPLLKEGKEKLLQLYRERIDLYSEYKEFEVINDGTIDDVVHKVVAILE